jgi:hypothetical protein
MHLEKEAEILTRYLIKKSPSTQVIELYAAALQNLKFTPTVKEDIAWDFGLKNPWSMSLIDAAFAINSHHNMIRKRILVMLAILETQSEYHSYFVHKGRPKWYVIVVIWLLVKGLCRKVAGKILLWFLLPR